MKINDFLFRVADELRRKSGIVAEIVDDRDYPGGFYMNFPEFGTAVMRVTKFGKAGMRGVDLVDGTFAYPWKYKFLLPTDETTASLAKLFPQVVFDSSAEDEKAFFPLFCCLNVLHQFYQKKLTAKRRWFPRYKIIEERNFEKLRRALSNLPSRVALRLVPQEDQEKYIQAQ